MFIERYTKELFCIVLTNGLLYMITIKIIDERLTGIGTTELAEKYHMPAKYIRQLVQQHRLQGCLALKSNAHVKRNLPLVHRHQRRPAPRRQHLRVRQQVGQ